MEKGGHDFRSLLRAEDQFTTMRSRRNALSATRSCWRRLALVALSVLTVTLFIIMAGSTYQNHKLERNSEGRIAAVNGAADVDTQMFYPMMELLAMAKGYFKKEFSYLQYTTIPKSVTAVDKAYEIVLEDSESFNDSRLINLNGFKYTINKDQFCPPRPEKPFLIVLVHSAVENRPKRDAIRQSWGLNVPVLFILGATGSETKQRSLLEEDEAFHDLVQGNFLDTYKNLTYKHAMVLKWTVTYCPRVKYLVKTDDDSFLNVPYLMGTLHDLSPTGARNLLACYVLSNTRVFRSGKWGVSRKEWPSDIYPDYCNGWLIIYSVDVAARIYMESFKHKYHWIDDVHIGGTLATALQIKRSNFSPLIMRYDENTPLDPRKLHLIGVSALDEYLVINMTRRFNNYQLQNQNEMKRLS